MSNEGERAVELLSGSKPHWTVDTMRSIEAENSSGLRPETRCFHPVTISKRCKAAWEITATMVDCGPSKPLSVLITFLVVRK